MNIEQIKKVLAMQSSIYQMLIVSNSHGKLPSEKELMESVAQSIVFLQKKEGVDMDDEVAVFMANLALNMRTTVEDPDGFFAKALIKMFE